tara:strand:- start:199 stop:438 length:240 start_codon:yes stop_codon:yes gene_type:complete
VVAAVVALVDVTAEGSGTTDLDEVHDAQMLGRKGMLLAIAVTVEAKDICEFPLGSVLWGWSVGLRAELFLNRDCREAHE